MGTPTTEKVVRTCKVEKTAAPRGGYMLHVDRIQANQGDTLRWEADPDHAISIWFPESGVFFTPSLAVMHKGAIEATIRDDAPHGVYEYVIYDHTEREFVTCESHPKVEIPKPGP
jgi:hypothetical protein